MGVLQPEKVGVTLDYDFSVVELKYPNNCTLSPDQRDIVQEIKLVNESLAPWPRDTSLVLVDSVTDLKVNKDVMIGAVPPKALVKISLRLNMTKSELLRHSFSYQLVY